MKAHAGSSHLIHSFDVFDTCITRRYARPADLFYQLGLQLADRYKVSGDKSDFAIRFVENRIHAERTANRSAAFRESATLQEIYTKFDYTGLPGIDSEELATTEIVLERGCIYPVPAIRKYIDISRSNGKKIIFVSDMYLPGRILGPILADFDLLKPADKLYVSCDVRLTKSSGNLFRHVLEQEGIRPQGLLHVGDNRHGDIEMPRSLGIAVSPFTAASLNRHEVSVAGGRRLSVNPQQSFLAALSRETRLSMAADEHETPAIDEIIHGTISPFLVTYVTWVIRHARQQGIRRLYFVARDGQIMYKIASELISADSDIELKYLYGSRKAWLHASITPESDVWTKALTPQGQANTIANILKRIGLDAADLTTVYRLLGIQPDEMERKLDPHEARLFIASLKNNVDVYDIILASASQARDLALRYFDQEGIFDNVPWALVDTGWSLNCQAALKRILSTHLGVKFNPVGYYIALMKSRLPEQEAGIAHGFVPRPEVVFCRRRTMIEHSFTPALHTSTRGYMAQNGSVHPVLGEEVRSDAELAYVQRLHAICAAQAHLVGRSPDMLNKIVSATTHTIESAENFILHPAQKDAKAMQMLSATADFFHESRFVQGFCRPFRFGDLLHLIHMIFSGKARRSNLPFVWLEGCCALSPAYIRLPLQAMLWCKLFLLRVRLR